MKSNAMAAEETEVTVNGLINKCLKPAVISLYLATRGNGRNAGLHHRTRGAVGKSTL